jgi:deazaflavin-dependent oxidoreductase (nitroreductase family)
VGWWKIAAARGVVARMALTGEYVPSATRWVRDNVEEYEASDGEKGGTLRGSKYPVVVVTSVGATSGKLRKNPVMRIEHDGVYAAVASYGGAPRHPVWYHNFVAYPEVELQDGPEPHLYRARIAEGEEREDLWHRHNVQYSGFDLYDENIERRPEVWVLEPA